MGRCCVINEIATHYSFLMICVGAVFMSEHYRMKLSKKNDMYWKNVRTITSCIICATTRYVTSYKW